MNINDIKQKIVSKKSKDRRQAAKEIGKNNLTELSDVLYQAYLQEIKDKRTWETQVTMITSLGQLQHVPALIAIEAVIQKNLPRDIITSASAVAYVRLKRVNHEDISTIIELLKIGSFSVVSGALKVLALDQMQPPKREIKELIKLSWDINKHEDRIGHEYGLIDPRIYLALACWNWDKKETTAYLNHCIKTAFDISRFDKPTENTRLINVCNNSLSSKVSKGYL